MSLVHDVIKIKYLKEGFLPDYPYHMISNTEMCNAFINIEDDSREIPRMFDSYYPLPDKNLSVAYSLLISELKYHIKMWLNDEDSYIMPDWVYSYMLGKVIGPSSDTLDIHDLLVMLNCDNLNDIFTSEAANKCYIISKQWISKLSKSQLSHRPPTMFGEPHVIKSLRLQ